MRRVALPSGERVPAFGQGTWLMGEDHAIRDEEIETLRLGLDLGATLIDTAEMYGEGRAEELIREALQGRRDEAFIVSKVYPHNAGRRDAITACDRSLRRLGTDRIDLYLLHWRGNVPLAETMQAFMELQDSGKIRYYGVSNFDVPDMEELWNVTGGSAVITDQILYNLVRRGAESALLPWLRERGLPIMAYSPIEQAKLTSDRKLVRFAEQHGMTPSQVALAWLLANDDVTVIPKTSRRERLKENLKALDCELTKVQLAALDRLYAPPKQPKPLEML
jgi:diketogulonate reductase-like aldo/keto reductase